MMRSDRVGPAESICSLSPFLRGEGWGEGPPSVNIAGYDSRRVPLTRFATQIDLPRIRLRQKAGFGGQERGEVKLCPH